tara:strand:- start:590 stop:1987 length:1398 start_codon:yes stop_codon:yes gene_type:complete
MELVRKLDDNSTVSIRNVYRRRGYSLVLNDVTLDIPQGSLTIVAGPNGAGKTTLLRLVCGLIRPDQGRIELYGNEMKLEDPSTRPGIAYVGHSPSSLPALSILENLQLAVLLFGVRLDKVEVKVLLQACGLWRRRNDVTRSLSRGMQQKLELVRAIVTRPQLMLLDEPFNALDDDSRLLFQDILNSRPSTTTVVIATHGIDDIKPLADRVISMENGAVKDDQLCMPVKPHGHFDRWVTSETVVPSTINSLKTLMMREFRREWKFLDAVPSMAILGVLMIIAFSMATSGPVTAGESVAVGALWASIAFVSTLLAVRGFSAESDQGSLDLLRSAPVSSAMLYISRWLSGVVMLTVVSVMMVLMAAVVFNVDLFRMNVLGIVVSGVIALSSISALYSAISVPARARELLAPIISLPATLPVVIAGSTGILESLDIIAGSGLPWLGLVLAYAAIIVSCSCLVIGVALEE